MNNMGPGSTDTSGIHQDFHKLIRPRVISTASIVLVLVITLVCIYAYMQMASTPLLTVLLFATFPLGLMAALAIIMDKSAIENLRLYKQYTSVLANTAPSKHTLRVSKERSEHGYILFADVDANGKTYQCEIIAHSDPIAEGVSEQQADVYFMPGGEHPVMAMLGQNRLWLEECPFRLGVIKN